MIMSTQSLIQRWKSEGYEEGVQVGRLDSLRFTILRVLELRFAQLIPVECVAQINASINYDVLGGCFDEAVTAPSLEWFLGRFVHLCEVQQQ